MELKIKVICENLPGAGSLDTPGAEPVVRQQVHLGIQHGDEVIEAVPVNRNQIVFEPSFRVQPLPDGGTNFLGPFAKGKPTERFFYLSWMVKGKQGDLTMFRRAKIHLSHLRWSQIEELIRSGKPLAVSLSLTDKCGGPRCGSLRDAHWQL